MSKEYQIVKSKKQKGGVPSRRLVFFYFLFLTFYFFSAGCNTANDNKNLTEQISRLNTQNTEQTTLIEQYKAENDQLKKQVQVLSGLPENVKGLNLYNLQKITIHRYTTISDSNSSNPGAGKSLIVYIQPIDGNGDKIKAAGQVDVQLWDLDKPAEQAILGQWHVDSQQLQKLWTEFLILNYRLKFDVSNVVKDFNKPLTVKIKFTDYLTGKVFEDQKVITPKTQ
jgi:cell division protein FtsB